MKKWLVRIVVGLVLLFVVIVGAVFVSDWIDTNVIKNYVKNADLKTVKNDWQGTPIDEKGRFVNHEFPFLPKTIDILRWRFGDRPLEQAKRDDTERLKVLDPAEFLQSERDGILWLGHASVYIRLGGKTVLIDPVFGEPSFVTRFVPVPDPLEKIKRVDYVLISHDHRDHCDEPTLRRIAEKFPNAKFLGGLEMRDLFDDWKTPTNTVENAGWFQQFNLGENDLEITFVPVRHWSRRGLFDTNKRLWGGYVIEGAGRKIYHGGDSGYGSHYKDLAQIFGSIDYFIIGIGAYEPRWFMEANHNNPADAWQAFRDANGKTLVPVHYGTFDLSDEPANQPLELLKGEARKNNLEDRLKPLAINEGFYF